MVRSITDVELFTETDSKSTILESEGDIDSVLEKDSNKEDAITFASINVKVVGKDDNFL